MSLRPSGSDTDPLGSQSEPGGAGDGSVFERFHPGLQRWLWNQQWRALRPIQEQTARAILDTDDDLIIAAPTASGKTEAAWLPICSQLARFGQTTQGPEEPAGGVQALYIAPLKALINDQYARLQSMCEAVEIPVHRWHGDVPGSAKTAVLRRPGGLLLITPESLEALFVNRGTQLGSLLGGLRHIVIDELHSFIGTERGAQLQSLMHRVELALRRRIPRAALSATLGDFRVACEFLRPGHGEVVVVIKDAHESSELKLQLRGYIDTPPVPGIAQLYGEHSNGSDDAGGEDGDQRDSDGASSAEASIASHLFSTLRGHDNLVFANSRRLVEQLTDRLTRASEAHRVPNEFVAHHGNLSREMREDAEARLKDPERPTSAVATSTLEMGIDIGSVDSIVQIGAPGTVSSLRQRLGRSGRRAGQAAVLRTYVTEHALDLRSSIEDQLRSELIQSIAMIDLLLEGWYETPNVRALHLSTLMQQILSVIAQHGGVSPAQAFSALCGQGPFRHVNATLFAHLLRAMGTGHLIVQDSSGLLLHGQAGESIVNHYSFYAAFNSAEEYRLIGDGRPIGSLPIDKLLTQGSMLIFGGRRWRVTDIDTGRKVITVTSTRGGRAPRFTGDGPTVADQVRSRMRTVLSQTGIPVYLDATGRQLLAQARDAFAGYHLGEHLVLGTDRETLIVPWRGDAVMGTLALAFTAHGLPATADGLTLTVTAAPEVCIAAAHELAGATPPDPRELAALVKSKARDKYDRFLDEDLLCASFAAASLDVPGAWEALTQIAADQQFVTLGQELADLSGVERIREDAAASLEGCGFAVIDVETTGLGVSRGDRIIEIAVVGVERDGTLGAPWSTLVDPGREPGPTHIHGLTRSDLIEAPRFAEVAGDVAERIAGRVIVAHNALFDLSFLHAEFARAGYPLPPWPTLCTLDASYQLRPAGPRTLAGCTAAENIVIKAEHTAAGDAFATAELLSVYLRDANSSGVSIAALGTAPLILPPDWEPPAASGRTCPRSRPAPRSASDAGLALRVRVARIGTPADDAYLAALDQVLADGHLSADDVVELRELAGSYGIDQARIEELNALYIDALASQPGNIDAAGLRGTFTRS